MWRTAAASALGLVLCIAAVHSHDRWEAMSTECLNDDDASDLCNQLVHGQPQEHDVEAVSPARDEDWMVVETKARRSYEVKMFSASTILGISSLNAASNGLLLNRVTSAGATLTSSTAPDGTINFADAGTWLAVRWTGGTSSQRDFIRVQGKNYGNPTANDRYVIELLDTTYDVPRFNSSGTQTTVLLLRNASPATLTGSIFFYSAAGALLHTEPLSLPVNGLQVVSTAAIGALAGQSGSAAIAHNGPYGAIAGKAVALEPSTGFTFDTAVLPVPK